MILEFRKIWLIEWFMEWFGDLGKSTLWCDLWVIYGVILEFRKDISFLNFIYCKPTCNEN